MWAAVRSRTADDDALVAELYRRYRVPLMSYVLRQLVAVSKAGERRVVMGWLVPAPGDGVPGHPAHLVIQGGTSIPRADLARVDVDVVNGRTLVTIPV